MDWIPGKVISAQQYYVQIPNKRGKQTNVAYEDIGVCPELCLTKKLSEENVKEYIADIDNAHRNKDSTTVKVGFSHVTSHSAPSDNACSNDSVDTESLMAKNRRALISEAIPVDDE